MRAPVRGRDEIAALGHSFNEMTARLEAAALRQQEVDQMRRDLIAWVGHDLRTPLASVRAIVEALADGLVEEPAKVERYLRTAQRDIHALSLLVEDLFEMSQLETGQLPLSPSPNSLTDLISDTLESFTAQAARHGVRLEGSVAPGIDPLWLDAQKIGRVLNNLVGNALRHTPPGGAVEIRAQAAGDEVMVEVSDTGEGILPEDLPRVFEQFYRGEKSRSRATGGAGLGLAIARRIVEAHGGRIEVQSEPGAGTQMRFFLPLRRSPLP